MSHFLTQFMTCLSLAACATGPQVPPPSTSQQGPAEASSMEDRHPALSSAADDPLTPCRRLELDGTITWSCGPDRVVMVQHTGPLPPIGAQPYHGGPPSSLPVDIQVSSGTLEGELLLNPRLEDGPATFTILLKREKARQVVSCAAVVFEGDDEGRLRKWCQVAMGHVVDNFGDSK